MKLFWLVCGAAALLIAAACGSSGDGDSDADLFPTSVALGECEVCPIVANSSLAVGENRMSIGLINKENEPVLDAAVHIRFFDLNGPEAQFKFEADTEYIPVELSFEDEQSAGAKQVVGNNGIYIAHVTFDRSGSWGMELNVAEGGEVFKPVPFRFDVAEKTAEVAVGAAAPPSRQPTTADVADISEIDSSSPARPQMHDITVADALATGKPLVIAFATPAFCESRICAPVMDTVMDPLYNEAKDDAIFIHIEPYRLQELRSGAGRVPIDATTEWGLRSEPWIFIVDAQGKIAAKFEGIIGLKEVKAALDDVLSGYKPPGAE